MLDGVVSPDGGFRLTACWLPTTWWLLDLMEPPIGFEPMTVRLQGGTVRAPSAPGPARSHQLQRVGAGGRPVTAACDGALTSEWPQLSPH